MVLIPNCKLNLTFYTIIKKIKITHQLHILTTLLITLVLSQSKKAGRVMLNIMQTFYGGHVVTTTIFQPHNLMLIKLTYLNHRYHCSTRESPPVLLPLHPPPALHPLHPPPALHPPLPQARSSQFPHHPIHQERPF